MCVAVSRTHCLLTSSTGDCNPPYGRFLTWMLPGVPVFPCRPLNVIILGSVLTRNGIDFTIGLAALQIVALYNIIFLITNYILKHSIINLICVLHTQISFYD